jgi:hypothetical protein
MADNRLFLMHRPSGRVACIGKRMGGPWGAGLDVREALNNVFDHGEFGEPEMDDFILLIESAGGNPFVSEEWDYHGCPTLRPHVAARKRKRRAKGVT